MAKGFERKRPQYASSAAECRARGLKVGDRIAGNEGYGVTVMEITAIGERSILGKTISHAGKLEANPDETSWTLSCRDWEKVEALLTPGAGRAQAKGQAK